MQKTKTPKIRFPQFNDEWKKVKLNEVFTERKESCVISKDTPQLAFTIAEGVINPEDKKTNKRDFLIKDIETKKFAITEIDDIIYNPANLKFGAIHRNKLKRGAVSPIYAIFSTNQYPAFMEYLVKRPSFIHESLKFLEGTVIKLMTLKPRDFLLMSTYIPTEKEQLKVADFFSTIDDYIKIEEDKIATLKDLNTAMLNKLFPQEDSLTPTIRFPEYTKPWIEVELSECASFLSGSGLCWDDISENGQNECILYGNLYTEYGMIADKISFKTDNIPQKPFYSKYGDVMIPASDTTPTGLARATNIEKDNVLLGGDINVLRPNSNINGTCLALAINAYKKELIKLIKGTSVKHIHNSDIKNVKVKMPTDEKEQEKLAAYFRELGNLITIHKKKLEALQQLKLGLLQKMFV